MNSSTGQYKLTEKEASGHLRLEGQCVLKQGDAKAGYVGKGTECAEWAGVPRESIVYGGHILVSGSERSSTLRTRILLTTVTTPQPYISKRTVA